jgi:serine/threonine protein phosphatase PrpC
MNPSKRSSFEDCSIYAPSGTWDVPDENMAFLAVADGHGGRDIVEFLEDGLLYHVSQELQIEQDDSDIRDDGNTGSGGNDRDANHNPTISSDDSIPKRLERAFLMVDIHSKAMGLTNSGATVAMCLVTRGNSIYDDTSTIHPKDDNDDNNDNVWKIYAANAGDARIVLGHGGKAHRMTRDHRTDDPEEVRRIEDSGGFIFKGRVLGILAVTRSLGDHCMKEYVSKRAMSHGWRVSLLDGCTIDFPHH